MVVKRFAALALCLLTAAPLLALRVGPELPVSPPGIEPAPDLRGAPLVASNGDGFLVVWYDRRGGASEIRAARVDRDGVVIDGQSKLVAGRAGLPTSVASNGRDYLIAYDCENGAFSDLCLSRVDALTGAVIPAGIVDGSNGALASNGGGYLLVYLSGTTGSVQPVTGLALREDGSPARAPFAIASSPFMPAVAANGEHYFVVWSTYADLEGMLVSDAAVAGTRQGITTRTPSFGPGAFEWAVASNGDGFLVAWQQNTGVIEPRYTTDLRVRAVSASGVAAEEHILVDGNAWQPALAWTGSDYLLTYTHSTGGGTSPIFNAADGDVRALALTAAGEPRAGTTYAATAGREASSAVAASRTSTLIVWENQLRRDAALVQGRLAHREGTFVLSTAPAWQQNVSLARDSSATLVAWEEIAGPGQLSRVMLHPYEANGARQSTFTVQASPRHQRRPVVYGGLVAWVEEEPDGSKASVWYQALEVHLGNTHRPIGNAERVGEAAVGTRINVLTTHVFHVIQWTAPDGRIAAVYRSLIARIGYDPSVFYVTSGPGVNPASDGSASQWPLIAYNNPVPYDGPCTRICPPRYGIRATVLNVLGDRAPQNSLDVAPVGASAPRVVHQGGSDYYVFWSMEEDGGTFVQHVSTAGGVPVAVGASRKIDGGILHDATLGKDHDFYIAVEEPGRYAVVRFDRNLNRIESIPFHAQLAGESPIRISGDQRTRPMLAYAATREHDGSSSQVVLRHVDDNIPVPKRRSAR